jgi:putative membrane protein
MKLRIVIIAALGVALGLYLVTYVGLGAVFSAAIAVGWIGFAILCCYTLALFLVLGTAWYVLLPEPAAVRLRVLVWARMVRDAAAEVLPFSQFGGIVIGARAAILQGLAPPLAFGSMIVDVTTELLAQIAYVALGIVILTARAPRTSVTASLTRVSLIGLVLAAVAGALFLALQRYGHRITARLAARLLRGAGAATAALSATLDTIYRSPARVALSLAIHFAEWIACAIGAWVAFRLIGVRVDLASVLAIESLVYAIRSAAAFVPNALGVQEGAYAVLAPLFGVGAEFGLAVSLLKRARDITIGVPVLLIWQAQEGQRALGAQARKYP